MMNIVVNATALTHSGAKTILEQFYRNAIGRSESYTIFVDRSILMPSDKNVTIVHIDKKNWLSRILWDAYGFKSFLRKECIKCDLVISLQNTSINYPKRKILYIHQPIPFSDVKFSIFKRDEWRLLAYKYFYSYFIFNYADDDTQYIVQTRWMKNALINKFGVISEKIEVIKPDIQLPKLDTSTSEVNDNGLFNILYPATFLSYKNHAVIIDALSILKKRFDISHVRFQVTLDECSFSKLYKSAKLLGVETCLENVGYVPQQELYKRYSKSQLVVFPSYLETFGLPLAEAAAFGKKILCSDLPYSKDVLSGYDGAVFVTHDNKSDWADNLESIIFNHEEKLFSYKRKIDSTWEDLFQLISDKHYV